MNYTENYQLNQWEETDRVLMEDFNADNQKIEEALGTIPQIIVGSYTDNDELSRTIDLGITPKMVLVVRSDGWSNSGMAATGGMAFPGIPVQYSNAIALEIVDQGFRVYRDKLMYSYYVIDCNISTYSYRYMAIV